MASVASVALPWFIQHVQDVSRRQRLFSRYERILQHAQTDLYSLVIQGGEEQVRQCQADFDQAMAQHWQTYRQSSTEQRMSQTMFEAIDARLNNVTARFRSIHEYQLQCFFLQAPTI